MVRFQAIILTVIACAGIVAGCTGGGGVTPTPSPEATDALTATPTPTPLISLRAPEVAEATSEVVYTQEQRASLGGRDMLLWPDGNIGFIPYEGKYRFFAANGPIGARTIGTMDDPGAVVEANRAAIEGASSEFAYLAGGPVYQDPGSDLVLMFYHAERHFGGSGIPFHAALGLAASHDQGQSFKSLGIILETNAPPSQSAPCCADMGGATYTIKDGQFYVYFRDRQADLREVELAVATASVAEVVGAAREGKTSPWLKYYNGGFTEPGLSGRSSPLEVGNPPTDWFGVSYNTALRQFIMAISTHARAAVYDYSLALASSEDGIHWSPRVTLLDTELELAYPTIIDPGGDPLNTGDTFYVYYVTTPRDVLRWHATPLQRMTVRLTGQMVELPHAWEFETDPGGWAPLNQVGAFEVSGGSLIVEATGNDPYIQSPVMGLSSAEYAKIEVRMKVARSGNGQIFFTTSGSPDISERASVRFPITGSEEFQTYTVDMTRSAAWQGLIGLLRFDPTDQQDRVEIDYIRLIP